jgi:hypothetical protein
LKGICLNIEEFNELYFKEIEKINKYHLNYLIKYSFTVPKCNYIELKRFIDTATNFLSEIDDNLLKGLTAKLYNDISSLCKFLKDFKKKVEYVEYVFANEYLPSLDEYRETKNKFEILRGEIENYNKTIQSVEGKLKKYKEVPKKEKELFEYKKLKKQQVDSIYYLSKYKEEYLDLKKVLKSIESKEIKYFVPAFTEKKEKYIKKLQKIINTKLYYFEKLLWKKAEESMLIRKFFEQSNIQGDFSTKTFINYYLKNIDINKSSNSDWYSYLTKILKVIE